MRTRLIEPHIDGCHSVAAVERGDWSTPWWMPGKTQYRDAIGRARRGAWRRWLVLECNDVVCSAVLVVAEGDVLAAITEG